MAQETITRKVSLAKGASNFFTFSAPSMPMTSYTWWMATCTVADKSKQQLREKSGAENRSWDTWYEGITDVNLNGTPRIWIKNNDTEYNEYNVSLILWYEETAHNITVTAGTGGSASVNFSTANPGDTPTVTVTPSTGYSANTPTAPGITFTSAGTNKWTFTMPAEDVAISCTFTHVAYTIGLNTGSNGSASVNMETAHYGDNPTVTCTPNTGYSANTPTSDGITFTSAGTNKWTWGMPAHNVTIKCTFYKNFYNVTTSAGTGGSASTDKATAQIGDTVTVTCSPNTGYKSNTPTCSGVTFTSAGTNKWTFTMPAKAVTISCTFSKISYTVTAAASPAAGGTLTSNKATANYGDTVTLTRTANTGYQFSSWTKSPSGLSIDSNLKFTMPAQNVSVTANFTKIDYAVTVNAGTGGTAAASKAPANYGDTVTITCTPSTGYSANKPTATGITFTAAGTNKWSFTMPAAGVTVSCTFTKINYTITNNSATGGSTSTNKSTANYGDTITITATPGTGYSANAPTVKKGNTSISTTSAGTNKWTFTMPNGNVTVTGSFTKINYTVGATAGTGGSAAASKATANYGDTITITCTPNTGYKSNTPTATGITFTADGTNKWTFTMPAANVSVSCTFSKISYTVTTGASPAAGGTLTRNKATANYGDTVTLTRTASAGYQFSSWTKTPSDLSINGSLQFTMPAQNVSITANFTKINYNVTVNSGTGGSAAASKTTANYGDTITIICTPNTGYKANTPTASGITFTAAGTNKWTFTMPAAAVTVSCTFSKINYNVTISYGSNGSATLDKATAQIGDTVTVTCSPNTGYKSNTPTATDITFTAAGTNKWTFTMPAKAVAVSCTFSKKSYTITAAASPTAGGTLTSDKSSAYYGDTVTLTRTEKSGYKFNSWTKSPNGLSIDNNLKFTMPAQNVSVTANFIKRDYTVTVNAGTGGTATGSVSTAQIGDTVTITCAASSGYTVNTPTASGITFTSAGTNKWSFTMPAANVTASCTFSKISYNVTVTAGTGGSASSNKSTAGIGDTVTITCTPNTGYKANTPTATGITFTAAGTNKWTFTMKAAAVSISCSFSKVSYTITKKVSPSGAGTVTTGANSAYYGDQVTVSQTPASGYYFNGWTITPNSVTVSSGKITMPAQKVTIQANYLKRSTATVNTTSITGGGTVTLTINPDKTTYSHKYKLSFGTGMETTLTAVAAGTNTVVINVPDSWSTAIPNATSKTGGTLLVETYNGNTKIGTYTITGLTYNVPASSKPSIGTITTSIARTIGGTTYANVGDYYVQSKCGVRIQASGSGNLGSSVSKLEVSISGYTAAAYKKTVNAASVDFTSGLLTVSGTATITIKATDSRGRTNTKTKDITVTAYKKPSGTLNVYRVDANGDDDPLGTYAKYSLTKTYTAVGSNSLAWSLKSQNVTANSPAASGNILPSSRQTFAQLSEYNIELKLVDAFETVTIITKLPTAQFMIFVNGNGDRIGIMQATNESRSKNGKDGTIEFSENHQIYIGDTTLEDYARDQADVFLTSSFDTWAKIWAEISKIASGHSKTCYINGTPINIMTNGEVTSGCPGIIARTGAGAFTILHLHPTDIRIIRITSASASGFTLSSVTRWAKEDDTIYKPGSSTTGQWAYVAKSTNAKTGFYGGIALDRKVQSGATITMSNMAEYGKWFSDGSRTLDLTDITDISISGNTLWFRIGASGILTNAELCYIRLQATVTFS